MEWSGLTEVLFWGLLAWSVVITFLLYRLSQRIEELRRFSEELNYRVETMEQWRKSLRQ